MFALAPSGILVRQATPIRALTISLAITVMLVAAGSRLIYLALPFQGDGAMFAYMGKLVVEGGRFGDDLIDNKFPTVGLITSVFYRAFGTWWPGYVISQLLMTIVGSMVLSRQAARTFGEHARWATFFSALVLMNVNAAVIAGFQLETIQAFFGCIAAACGLSALTTNDRRDALACGLAAGCATLVKPTGAGVLAAFLIASIVPFVLPPRNSKRILQPLAGAAILGVLAPILVAIAYLHASDQLRLIPSIAQQIGEYARSSSFAWEDALRPIILLFLFATALLIRGWVYRRDEHRVETFAPPAGHVFAWAWLAIELGGVILQRRMYGYHFLPLACPAALVFASIPRRTTVAQLAGPLALPILFSIWGGHNILSAALREPFTAPAVAKWLDDHTLPGERIWHDYTPYTLLHSDVRSASKLQLTFLFMNSNDSPARFASVLLTDFRTTRPRYIVLPADLDEYLQRHTECVFELARLPRRRANFIRAWRDIEEFVTARYVPGATIGQDMIWRRKDIIE